MTITLYHHPYTRAANVVWMLEEVGVPYELAFVDVVAGAQKAEDLLTLNPMGKLPTLVDDGVVITESAAIALYLGDRYASPRLAPALDDPRRASYLRWSFFAPSVIEPNLMAKVNGWTYKEGQAGWGNHEAMLTAIETALAGDYVLGDQFTMADCVLGGTLRYMLRFKMIEPRDRFVAYAERLGQRPAAQRAEAINAKVAAERLS